MFFLRIFIVQKVAFVCFANFFNLFLMRKILYILLIITILGSVVNAQIDNLSLVIDTDSIILNSISLNNFDRQTEIDEIKGLYKLSPWHFAPGLSYDFIRNRYYITLSTSGLVSHFLGKRQENRRVSAIERKYKAKDLADQLRINNKVLAIQADHTDLILAVKVVQIEIDIFLIQKQQYENNEIDTERFLTAKRNIINTVKNHNSAVTGLYKNILDLSNSTDSTVPVDLSSLYFDIEFLDN